MSHLSSVDDQRLGSMSSVRRSTFVFAVLLLLGGVLVACGGSATRGRPSPSPPNVGGEGGDDAGGRPAVPSGGAVTGGAGGGASGGVSNGGAFGGSNLGGSGGVGAQPSSLPLPAGCEPRQSAETEDSCSLAVYCDTASRFANCQRLSSGSWRCQCDPIHPERVYHVEGAEGLNACAVAAAACSDKELELGEESCEEASASSPQGDCSTELACGRPIELGVATDARAKLMRFVSASCTEAGGFLDCRCASGEVEHRYGLVVDGRSSACPPLAEFCLRGTSPEYDGEEECFPSSATTTSEGCERKASCIVPARLNGEIRLGQIESRYANCVPHSGGGSDCYCSTRTSVFSFRSAAEADDASCESSILNCAAAAVIEPTSSAVCAPTSADSSAPTGCYADLDCTQGATVDGREIIAKGRLLVACSRVEEGSPWWCSCASDQKTTRFQLGADELEPSEACGEAPARCVESLPVHLGMYGEYVPAPDPLP